LLVQRPVVGAQVSASRRSRAIVGTAVLAAVAVLGYYTYRQSSFADAPQPRAASSDASGRGAPAGPAFLDGAAGDSATKSVAADDGAGVTGPAISPSEPPPPLRCVPR